MSDSIFRGQCIASSNDVANGGDTTPSIEVPSKPIQLGGTTKIGIQLTVHAIWGAETPNVSVKLQVSENGINFTDAAGGPAISSKTAAGAWVDSAEVTATWVRFVATLAQGAVSTQTGPAAVIFDVDASMNVTDEF